MISAALLLMLLLAMFSSCILLEDKPLASVCMHVLSLQYPSLLLDRSNLINALLTRVGNYIKWTAMKADLTGSVATKRQ